MKGGILLVGAGDARDHATYRRLKAEGVRLSFALLGDNGLLIGAPGVERVATLDEALGMADRLRPDVVVVQRPELLFTGAADKLARAGAPVLGPSQAAAEVEASKVRSKRLMEAYRVATPAWRAFDRPGDAAAFLTERWSSGERWVIKADRYLSQAHLRTVVPESLQAALQAVAALAAVPQAERGEEILIERLVEGPEISVHLLLDGRGGVAPCPPVCDYKTLFDGDVGPNTHGMGAVASSQLAADGALQVERRVVQPTLLALASEGLAYSGVLYIGVVFSDEGPVALEYNVRPGNPEWPTLLPMLTSSLASTLEAMATGKLDSVTWRDQWFSMTTFVTVPGYPFVRAEHGAPVRGLGDLLADGSVEVLGEGVRLRPPEWVAGEGRSIAVVADGAQVGGVRARIHAALERIRFPGMHYRTDIGLGRHLVAGAALG